MIGGSNKDQPKDLENFFPNMPKTKISLPPEKKVVTPLKQGQPRNSFFINFAKLLAKMQHTRSRVNPIINPIMLNDCLLSVVLFNFINGYSMFYPRLGALQSKATELYHIKHTCEHYLYINLFKLISVIINE